MTKKFGINCISYTKCRWFLIDGRIHIQVKGPEMNRPYGLSMDISLNAFEDQSIDNAAFFAKHFKGNTNSLRDGVRPYSKGGICVTENSAGQRAVRFLATRNASTASYKFVTSCCKVDSDVLDWIENN